MTCRPLKGCVLFLTLFAASADRFTPAVAAPVDWVKTRGKSAQFPDDKFNVGFGMSASDKNMSAADKMAYARNMACRNLAQSITVKIQAEDTVRQFSSMVKGKEDLVDEFKSAVVARSDLNLDGIQFTDYTEGKASEPAYALAYLDRDAARSHYRGKFTSKMKELVENQRVANDLLMVQKVAAAQNAYLKCNKLVAEIEEIILIRQLLGDVTPVNDADLKQIVDVKSKAQQVWEKAADSMEEAAEQLAVKIAGQEPPAGKLQVNALTLDDTYQYSRFSTRFRSLLEKAIQGRTKLSPLIGEELDFTPQSARITRLKLAANGADYLVSGSYFVKEKEDDIYLYVRVSKAATGEIVASATAHMKKSGAGDVELKPRNFLQALQDQKVFSTDEIVGGGLNLEVWSNKGVEGLALQDGEEVKICVRANKPCYVRFIYHLCTGERIIPDRLYLNYFISTELVNKVVTLPDTFTVCAPYGTECMQFFASTDQLPDIRLIKKRVGGEDYDVLTDTLQQSNLQNRGIKKKQGEVEIVERRIALTTVAK